MSWIPPRYVIAKLGEAHEVPATTAPVVEEGGVRRQRELSRRARSESLTEQIRRAQAAGDDARIEELLRAKMSLA